MPSLNVTLVSGAPGAGKTTWIRQQAEAEAGAVVYVNVGSGETSVDSTYLAAEATKLVVLQIGQLSDFLKDPSVQIAQKIAECAVYIELGFHIDLYSLVLPENIANCRRVVLLSPEAPQSEWHKWADIVVAGAETRINLSSPHFWRSPLTGQVIDFNSLDTFWYELTAGAYGTIQRAKGIFDISDGRSLYFDFAARERDIGSLELNLPRWLDGRPQRFSGIEIVGEGLDSEAIAQTLESSCLEDRAIAYYQQKIKESLATGGNKS
ncbi:GTP-binding protein [Merismopedia glauca]|uniref:GTPase, G3E family protein n=1 Tax=Merismopedia glauca CCAP 1448/3 TaxID=1296344 RepID=A0A2T1C2Z7_9CYAN|nr:GTP-binding protein [Merismopedia glauca]PSB02558.1 GTPase, G3E family protein [Merismopedia glauca CCAP 1448/3]